MTPSSKTAEESAGSDPQREASRPQRRGRSGRRVAAFVRHGHFDRPPETASAHQLLPLSQEGRDQARATASILAGHAKDHGLEIDPTIEASPLLRAWETARILAETLGSLTGQTLRVEEQAALMERGLGSCANLRFDEIAHILGLDPRLAPLPEGWRRIPDFRLPVPGAESLLEAGQRTAKRIEGSLDGLPVEDGVDRMRVFVAHSGCLRHAAVHLGALAVGEVRARSMAFAQAILIERHEDGRWTLLEGDWQEGQP